MNVLFVCSGNIGRSQMAMEYFKRLGIGETASAGTRVTVEDEKIGGRDDAQNVLKAMHEDGIDMSSNTRTTLLPEMLNSFDKVVVMAEPDRIPEWLSSSPKFEYWEIPNVNGMPIEKLRAIRDDIKSKVSQLAQKLMNKVSHDSETLAQGQQVITACAFIHRKIDGVEKVFLPKRADTKKFLPGKYEIPGGHIDYGEDVQAGLIREVQEELGVVVKLGDPFAVFTYTNEVKGSHSIEVVYFAQLIGEPDDITISPDDHSAFGWFTEDEAVNLNGDNEDEEVTVIRKGFALLRGESPKF